MEMPCSNMTHFLKDPGGPLSHYLQKFQISQQLPTANSRFTEHMKHKAGQTLLV